LLGRTCAKFEENSEFLLESDYNDPPYAFQSPENSMTRTLLKGKATAFEKILWGIAYVTQRSY
jgi:hypothetical protein